MSELFRESDYYRSKFKITKIEYDLNHECTMCGKTAPKIYKITIPNRKCKIKEVEMELCYDCAKYIRNDFLKRVR